MQLLPVPPGGSVIEFAASNPQFALFVDGTVKKGRQAGGAVLKNAQGQVVATTGWRFEGATLDSNLAEANALEAGLAWLEARGVTTPTVVYLDSFQALEHLQKATGRYAVLERVRERLARGCICRLQNIERKRNKLADDAARRALQAP